MGASAGMTRLSCLPWPMALKQDVVYCVESEPGCGTTSLPRYPKERSSNVATSSRGGGNPVRRSWVSQNSTRRIWTRVGSSRGPWALAAEPCSRCDCLEDKGASARVARCTVHYGQGIEEERKKTSKLKLLLKTSSQEAGADSPSFCRTRALPLIK